MQKTILFLRDYGIRPTVYSSGHDFLGKKLSFKIDNVCLRDFFMDNIREVVAKVMFLIVSVILLTGRPSWEGGPLGRRPPGKEAPPRKEAPLKKETPLKETPPEGGPSQKETSRRGTPKKENPPKEASPLTRRPPRRRHPPKEEAPPPEGGPPRQADSSIRSMRRGQVLTFFLTTAWNEQIWTGGSSLAPP